MNFFIRQPAWVLFMVLIMLPLLGVLPYGLLGVGLGRGLVAVGCLLLMGQMLWLVALQRFLWPRLPLLARPNKRAFYSVAATGMVVYVTLLITASALPDYFVLWQFGRFVFGFPFSLLTMSPGDFMLFSALLLLLANCGMVSLTLRSIELNRPMGPGMGFDYIFTLLLLPLGIWFIQPKINRLYHGLGIDDEEVDF